MNILVIDGQGGGIGKNIIEQVKSRLSNVNVTAVGTNSTATSNMLKAGADNAATGENSVVVACKNTDIIIGPIGIVITDSMIGEITQVISNSIARSDAVKILIPVSKCHAHIAGLKESPISKYIDDAIDLIKNNYIKD